MKYIGFKFLLTLLKGLMYIKRGFVWVLGKIQPVWATLSKLFNDTAGFWLYKIYFFAKRRLQKISVPWDREFMYVLGKRSTLQTILFAVAAIIMIPHTKLHKPETISLPGRTTLLYALVGPGEQDFELEEIEVDLTLAPREQTRPWQEGVINGQQPGGIANPGSAEPQEISGIGAGGTAITKPTIISGGGTVNPQAPAQSEQRPDTIVHEVKAGETIGAIAQTYGISVETILWANGLTTRSYIRPGDKLKIPPATGVLHKVARGETISKIAKKYGAKEGEIIKANRLQQNGSDIVIGEELIIPGGRPPTAAVVLRPTVTKNTQPSTALRDVAAPPPSISAPAGSGYIWPTNVRRITQYFGLRHTGVDIAGPIGSPLYAAKAGKVIKSQCGWNGGYGCYVIIDHGGGVTSLYGHASKLYAEYGQQVEQGEVIALMGSTGRSTGPHIHFEVRVNGRHDNPLKYSR